MDFVRQISGSLTDRGERDSMEDYIIVTDSSADMPKSYLKKHGVSCVSFKYTIDGVTYDNDDEEASATFYQKVRNKNMPTTSQINPEEAREHFEKLIGISRNILCLSFSSALSGTCNSFMMAAKELMEENPGLNIRVIDTLAASMGQGLMVYKAIQLKEQGRSLEEVADYIEKHKFNFVHVFTVDDLDHLYRGGRLSKTAAMVGGMISLKPVLHVNNEGSLVNMFNVRGRKKSLHALVDYMEKTMGSYRDKNDIVFISHADNEEDARYVAEEVKNRFGIENIMINEIGPTIGSHTGPDVIALFFMGENR